MFMSHGPSVNSKHVAIFSDYKRADKFIGDAQSHQFGRQAGSLERRSEGRIGLRYHATDVMTLYPNGDTSFNTGGWDTPSTNAWMNANKNFEIHIYQMRSGERKPYCYSTIRFAKHDRKIERQLREEWGLPTFAQHAYIWEDTFTKFVKRSDDTYERVITDPIMHERAQRFRDELVKRRLARHPSYVLHNGITFTKRGRCIDGVRLRDALREEKAERALEEAEARRTRGLALRYTNTLMKALREGLTLDAMPQDQEDFRALVERREPNGALIMRIVGRAMPGDARHWLNLHTEGDRIVMGDLPPVVEPLVRKRVYETLKAQL